MFDPYHKWLGIQPDQQPPTWYQLLGISPRERDPEVIEEAAIRQTAHVRTYQNGPYAQECARILGEIARARATLLDPAKRQQYDLRLAQSAAPREVGPAPASAAAPVASAGNEFQFFDNASAVASPSGEMPDVLVESPVSSLIRKRTGTSSAGKKLGFMVAIVLGAALPVGGLLLYYTWGGFKSHPDSTHLARGAELAPVKPEPGSTVVRVVPTTPAVPRPSPKPQPKPTSDVGVPPPPNNPPADGDNRPNPGRPGERNQPVKNVPSQKATVEVGEIRRLIGHTDRVTSVALSADGRRAVSGSADGTVRLWDTATGQEREQFKDQQDEMTCVAMSPDGSRYVSGGKDGRVRLHFVDNEQSPRSIGLSNNRPTACLTISPDGGTAIFGTTTGEVWLWPLEPGRQTSTLRKPRTGGVVGIYSVAVSPNGRLVLTADSNGFVQMWNSENGREVGRLLAPLPEIKGLAFSPDGLQVVTGGANGLIQFWNAGNGQRIRRFKGHTQPVTSLSLSGDGRRLLSGSDDKTVRLWDVKTRKPLYRFSGHTAKVTSVAIAADGRLAISGSDDKTVRVWSLPK